jgi:hypothetical protein
MSSFKVTITLESSFTTQELADFFVALAKSEKGDVQPLFKILHPVDPPPAPTPPVSPEPERTAMAVSTPQSPVLAPEPQPKNIQWQRSNFTLVEDATLERIIEQIQSGEFLSPSPNVSWFGHKHSPHAQHNRRIFDTLKSAPNRTMSFTSLGAQAGIPDKEKLKSYLREMDKQGLIMIQKA